jgi:hypothetical protein
MNEYHKIQTLYKRDMERNGKTLLEGQWTLPEFEYLAGNVWVFTEKVDGTNIRVMLKDGAVTFGGKTESAQIPAQLVTRLNERFLPLATQMQELFGCDVCLYGEGYGAKIQKVGGNYRADQDFVLFDILVRNAEYDTIKSCPRHRELTNATLSDLTSLKGFVNPAITGTLRNKILNGRQTSSEGLPNTIRQTEELKTGSDLLGSATLKQNSESVLKNTKECCQGKVEYVRSAQEQTTGTAVAEESCLSPSTTATTQEKSGDCCAQPAIQRFIKQSETSHGLMQPECTCKINDWWLQRADVEDVAQKLGLDVVPIIGEGTLHDAVSWAKKGIVSTWGDFQAEGIVARPKTELNARNGHRIITKIKCRDFGV